MKNPNPSPINFMIGYSSDYVLAVPHDRVEPGSLIRMGAQAMPLIYLIPGKLYLEMLSLVIGKYTIERGYMRLENCGISRRECNALRLEVAERILAYNSILWDWCHLGLLDVLYASLGFLTGEKHRLSDVDFERFYWRAMNIALKGYGK